MTIDHTGDPTIDTTPPATRPRRRAASRPAGPPANPDPFTEAADQPAEQPSGEPAEQPAPIRRRARKAPVPAVVAGTEPTGTEPTESGLTESAPAGSALTESAPAGSAPAESAPAESAPAASAPAPRRRTRKTAEPAPAAPTASAAEPTPEPVTPGAPLADEATPSTAPVAAFAMPLFQAPDPEPVPPRRRRAASRPAGPPVEVAVGDGPDPAEAEAPTAAPDLDAADLADGDETGDLTDDATESTDDATDSADDGDPEGAAARRRRRRRGGRGRRGRTREDGDPEADGGAGGGTGRTGTPEPDATADQDGADDEEDADQEDEADGPTASRRRRRRRRRAGGSAETEPSADDPPNTVVRVRESRRSGGGSGSDDVVGLRGSTRLEAKKMRRREGREAGRRRPVITEAEFLARRESVERIMVMREKEGRTQIGVLEDGVLVEHYVARRTQTSSVGNVYLGRVQNVLPSMEAAFVDVGKGRNAVLYAGEVNWDAAGLEGQPKRIEHALKSGESVLVQVTKDPIGHKGARLTSQISLPGRYLVYVPDGSMTGISRKLPENERARLKRILNEVVPDHAGVIVRTAAEGASEEELTRDVARLQAHWEDISRKAGAMNAPAALYSEPDLAIRVVRDIFNEDFSKLIVSGEDTWDVLHAYIGHVAPDLVERLEKWTGSADVFAAHRIDEQLAKALDRKVWLPSGGSLVIDRTEAMTVVDVNTGKFTGSGGNLEETVTKNNIEAAEEIVRQLRLRDIGGIIVVDFIDMVLESNRDLVLRRLLECLGRDRTKHQVAEVTSLGLVQMTRKRVGQGLLEVFSETCEHCGGRGIILHDEPVEKRQPNESGNGHGGSGGSGGSGSSGNGPVATPASGGSRSRGRSRSRGSSGGGDQAGIAVAASGG